MAGYVDGFVIPIPKKNVNAYKKLARMCGKLWMSYGALTYFECAADDVKPGKWTSFPQSVKLKKDEIVYFSFIVYKNKSQRDKILKKVMNDERITKMMQNKMPFDGKRMIFGGFKPVVVF